MSVTGLKASAPSCELKKKKKNPMLLSGASDYVDNLHLPLTEKTAEPRTDAWIAKN